MRNSSRQSTSIFAQSSRSRETVAFRFLTSESPAMLMTVTTYHLQYLAIILAQNGTPAAAYLTYYCILVVVSWLAPSVGSVYLVLLFL